MVIKVHTYGNVSPSFRNLTVEIFGNVSKDMKYFPPEFNLHLCKSAEDGIKLRKEQTRKLSRILGHPLVEGYVARGIGTNYFFKFPETMIVEDFIKPRVKYLEEYEGSIAHEAGHASDLFKNQRIFLSSTPLMDCAFSMKCEYEAENNAIEVGYYSGLLARNVEVLKEWTEDEESQKIDFIIFYKQLNLMAGQAAFMQSDKPPQIQKQLTKKLWDKFSKTRKFKAARELAQSKEFKESPEQFGNEDFLEDFVFKKHYDWDFSL